MRAIFGRNLRRLSDGHVSVAGLCRDFGINRTQFNRYLGGESSPRPDVMHRICRFFGTDARILLEPAYRLNCASFDLLDHPAVSGFFGSGPIAASEDLFPSGFYRFVRRSFIDKAMFVMGLVHIHREDGYTFLRGYEPRSALLRQGLSTAPRDREYRGIVIRQEEGIAMVVTHRNSMACSFNFLAPDASFQQTIWGGYVTRTVGEKVSGIRAARMVYEHLGHDPGTVMAPARTNGLVTLDQVSPALAHMLRLDQPFR